MWPGQGIGGCSGGSDTQNGLGAWWLFNAFANGTDQTGEWSTTAGPNGINMWGYAVCAEMIKIFKYYFKDFDFSPASFDPEGWLTKGPRGDFMKEKETVKKMVDLMFAPMRHGYGLYEIRQYLRWIEDKLTMDDRANALTQKIIKEFPAPLPPKDVSDRMNAIIAKYDKMYQIGGYTVDKSGTGARF